MEHDPGTFDRGRVTPFIFFLSVELLRWCD